MANYPTDHAPRPLVSRTLPAPHFRYSPVMSAGGFVFVSGMVALDPASGRLLEGDAYAQTRRILDNFRGLLDEMGWSLEQLVLARVFFIEGAFPGINQAWEEAFAQVTPPARTSVGVSALPLGALVEIEFQLLAN